MMAQVCLDESRSRGVTCFVGRSCGVEEVEVEVDDDEFPPFLSFFTLPFSGTSENHSSSSGAPDAPKNANIPRQPNFANRIGDKASPSKFPQWKPENAAPSAVAREFRGTCLATSEDIEGRATPSPRPTAARASSAASRVREETRDAEEEEEGATEPAAAAASSAGVASCASEKKAIPKPKTLRPPNLSAAVPPTSWVAA